jgi:hypothetical protein
MKLFLEFGKSGIMRLFFCPEKTQGERGPGPKVRICPNTDIQAKEMRKSSSLAKPHPALFSLGFPRRGFLYPHAGESLLPLSNTTRLPINANRIRGLRNLGPSGVR